MKRIVTQNEMTEIDRQSEKKFNIPSTILMENAGRCVVECLQNFFNIPDKDFPKKNFLIFCGKGNNGGDGFVAARFLLNKKAKVTTFLLGELADLKGEAKVNAERYKNMGGEIIEVIEEDFSFSSFVVQGKKDVYLIDAILGTGVKDEIVGIYKKTIDFINQINLPVISVDLPSGVMEEGKIANVCVKASLTITMGFIKRSLILPPARDYTGKIFVGEIGIPFSYFNNQGNTYLVEENDIKEFFPTRVSWGHKGTFGTCLIVAGSKGYSGAACLAALGALKIGAGLVYLATPITIMDIIETKLTEIVKIPLNWDEGFTVDNVDTLIQLLPKIDVIAIGPGIGVNDKTKIFIKRFLTAITDSLCTSKASERIISIVIDADAINCLREEKHWIKSLTENKNLSIILTPHPGELSRLMKISPNEINENRIEVTYSFSQEYRVYLVLKGSPTVIGTPEGFVYVNPTGNSGLASGGSGDVLTGFIAGLLAQGLKPKEAAIAGVYLHGLSADLALTERTEYDFIASDIFFYLPKAIKNILNA